MKPIVLILTAVVTLAACDASPTEPGPAQAGLAPDVALEPSASSSGAQRQTYDSVTEYDGAYWGYACDGVDSELIAMEGVIRHRVTYLEDGSGGWHYDYQMLSHSLRGVGVESGDVFHAVEVSHESSLHNVPEMGQHDGIIINAKLVGPGGRGFTYMANGKFGIDANGQIVVDIWREGYSCEL